MAAAVRLLRVSVPRQYLWPLLSLLGVCFGFIFLLIFLSTRAQDAQQLERERQALGGVFATASAMVQHDLQDYAKWDDAVRHIGSRFDAAWMDDNVVAYLGRTQGYSDIFVLGADDRTLYSFKDRKIAPNTAQLHLGADFVRSIAEVRRLPPEGSPIVSGFTRSGNQVLVYATAAVVPLTGKIAAPRGPTRLLVIARQVDEAFLADLTRELNVHEVRLTLGNRTAGMDAIAIKGRSGERIAWLEWRSHHPGASLRQQLVPAILAVAFVAFVAAGLILRRGSQSIEALRASELLARHLSDHDPLTELPNRRALGERLGELVAARQGLALLFLDLDGFKDANDVYGHSAGDLLLKEAAGRLKAAAGEAFIARAGGDEFAVLLRSPSSGVAAATCEAILEAFSTPFKVGAYSITIGTSIGYFESATSCDSAEELIRKADVAMYAAKDAGRNCAQVYHPSLDEGHERRQRLEQDLKRAVENEEIYVRYQPIVDAQSGEVVAVEALEELSEQLSRDGSYAETHGMQLSENMSQDLAQWYRTQQATNPGLDAPELWATDLSDHQRAVRQEMVTRWLREKQDDIREEIVGNLHKPDLVQVHRPSVDSAADVSGSYRPHGVAGIASAPAGGDPLAARAIIEAGADRLGGERAAAQATRTNAVQGSVDIQSEVNRDHNRGFFNEPKLRE